MNFFPCGQIPFNLARSQDTRSQNEKCHNSLMSALCGSKNYPYLPHGRDFSLDPPPTSREIPVKLNTFTSLFGPFGPPPPLPPQEFPIRSSGGVWIFSKTTHCTLVSGVFKVSFIDHQFDNLESGEVKYCFGKKS